MNLTSDHQYLISSSLDPTVCAKFEEIPSQYSSDIVFSRMVWTAGQTENILHEKRLLWSSMGQRNEVLLGDLSNTQTQRISNQSGETQTNSPHNVLLVSNRVKYNGSATYKHLLRIMGEWTFLSTTPAFYSLKALFLRKHQKDKSKNILICFICFSFCHFNAFQGQDIATPDGCYTFK